jgi:hypothetical protein
VFPIQSERHKKMNSRRIICAATLLVGAVFFPGIAHGQTANTLVITENSSTSLTATLNGVSYSFTGSDQWAVLIPGAMFVEHPHTIQWQEPPGETTFNRVSEPNGLGTFLFVSSDLPSIPGESGLPNGATDTTGFTIILAGSGGMQAPLDVTFIDNGDIPSVPDTATTLPLLGLALAAMGFAKRRLL